MAGAARPQLRGAAPGGAYGDHHAAAVRPRRQGDRQRGTRHFRRVRQLCHAAARRLHRHDAAAAAGPGRAWGWRVASWSCWARSPRGTPRCRSSRWCWSRSPSSSPAWSARPWPARRPRCCSPSSCRCRCPARLLDPRPGGRVGARLGGGRRRDRGALAGSGTRTVARARQVLPARRLPPDCGPEVALHMSDGSDVLRARPRAGDKRQRRQGRGPAPDLHRDALPPDRAEHGDPYRGPPRRRAGLARRHHRPVGATLRPMATSIEKPVPSSWLRPKRWNRVLLCSTRWPATPTPLRRAMDGLADALTAMEQSATGRAAGPSGHAGRRRPGERVHQLARPQLSRAGAVLRGVAGRRQHRPHGRRRTPRLARPPARAAARRLVQQAFCGFGAGDVPRRAALGLAAQQHPRRRRSRPRRAARRRDRRPALVLGRARHACRCCAPTRSTPGRTSCAGWPAPSSAS